MVKKRYLKILEAWAIKKIKEYNLGYSETWYFNVKGRSLILYIIKQVNSRSKFIRDCFGQWEYETNILAGHISGEIYILKWSGELIRTTYSPGIGNIIRKDEIILKADINQ